MVSHKAQFAQTMTTHKSALVHISPNAVDMALTSILPQQIVVIVDQDRLVGRILCYHKLVAIKFAGKIAIVEIGACINQWFLMISHLNHVQKLQQRVAESLCSQSLFYLYMV